MMMEGWMSKLAYVWFYTTVGIRGKYSMNNYADGFHTFVDFFFLCLILLSFFAKDWAMFFIVLPLRFAISYPFIYFFEKKKNTRGKFMSNK